MEKIQNEIDLKKIKEKGTINESVLNHIESYFYRFVQEAGKRTDQGMSIKEVGIIVILQKDDCDILDKETMFSPSFFRSIPEDVKVYEIKTLDGKTLELYYALFLPNNEFGVDLFCVKGEVDPTIEEKLQKELEDNGGNR